MKKKCCLVLVLMLLVSFSTTISAQDIPKKAVKLVNKGDEALQEKDFEKALEVYNKAIEIAPEYALAYFGRGRLFQAQGKLEDAAKDFEKSVELDSTAPQPKNFLAQVLFKLGGTAINQRQMDKSNEYFLKVLEIPDVEKSQPIIMAKSLFQIATNYFMMRKSKEANECYLRLMNLSSFATLDKRMVIQATFQAGATFSALKQHEKAVEYFSKLLDFPELQTEYKDIYFSTLYMIGLNANFANNLPKSIEYMTKFINEAGSSPNHAQFLPLANLLLGSGKMTQLQKKAEKVEGKDKVKEVANMAKSMPEIETYLSKAIELKPELEPAYMHLGNYYYYCDNLDKAIETYKALIEKFPNSPDLEQYKKFLADIEKESKEGKKK